MFREFPLDIKAAAGRCWRAASPRTIRRNTRRHPHPVPAAGNLGDGKTSEQLALIGKQAGLSEADVDTCLKDQALLDKIAADQKFANEKLNVNSTPTFFINGEMLKGETSFEEFDKRIKALLKT